MAAITCGALHNAYIAMPETIPGRDAWTWEAERETGTPA